MNTQTHVLLALALFSRGKRRRRTVGLTDPQEGAVQAVAVDRSVNSALIIGALLPDVSLFVMWGVAKWQGIAEHLIWTEWYYSARWQQAGAISNSIPLYLLIGFAGVVLLRNPLLMRPTIRIGAPSVALEHEPDRSRQALALLAVGLYALALGALLHLITDLPLHHDDGHPHFWPFSYWIFASPVSYWDSRHFGHLWKPIECLLGLWCIVVLWRRYRRTLIRGLLLLAITLYLVPVMVFS